MNENNVTFNTGAKVWLILCIISSVGTALTLISSAFSLMAILSLGGAGLSLWLLIGKKKFIFYVDVALIVLICFINLTVYGTGMLALLGLLNPVITYAFISKHWSEME